MDVIETLLKLPESERQKLAEALLLLRNVGANVSSNDSAGKSGADLKDSLNLSNNTPEKPVSKQKTLDSWIVKNRTQPSSCEKEMTNSKEIVPIAETGEASRNFDSEEVSSTVRDQHLPCSLSAPIEKSSKSENVIEKKLMVLLNRQDCLESKHKSPEHSEFSFEKKSISPIEIKSPSKKHAHISENSDERTLSPEKHSSTPPRSYNLRSARGVSDEKPSSEASNSLVISPEKEDRDKINRSVTKQKPKFKNSVGKDASPNSSTCLKEAKYDQKTDSCNEIMSKGNNKSFECKTPSTVVTSELEKTSEVISNNNNKITLTDESPIPVELGAALVVKGKRKRASKGKESKKLCVANTAQKNSPEERKVNNKSVQSIPSKKVTKLNAINENPSESSIEKTVQLPRTDESTSPIQKQISSNDAVKSVSKLKLKKTSKRKVKNDVISYGKTKLDSTATEVKKKSLPNPEIDAGISKNVVFQNETFDKQLKSATTSESQSKECAKETEELFTKDVNSVISVNVNSKKISRKRGDENKNMKAAKNSLLSDSEMASKINDEESIGEDSLETSSKIFQSQNKKSAKEIEELLIKDKNAVTSVNVGSKRTSRKRGIGSKSMVTTKNSLISDSGPASKNSDKDRITSIETSSKISHSQNNEFAEETDELSIKDTNTVIPINVSSKKKFKKRSSENKSIVAAKNSLSSDSGQASKNDEENSITSTETLSVDSSKNSPSQSKECSEELLIKDKNAVTSVNVGSKRTNRKRGIGSKSMVTTKSSLISYSEQTSKNSDKDSITSIATLSIDSSKNSPSSIAKELSTKQTSSINNTSTTEKITLSLNQNKCSQSVILCNQSGDHNRKNSLNSSDDELDSLNKMKESPEDQSRKSSAVSPNVPQSNNNVLHPQGNSNLSGVSKKLNALKKQRPVPANSRKKLKVTKDENQSNTYQSISDNLDSEMENPGLNLKRSSSKKKVTSLKLKVVTDSSKEHSDVLITKSKASSSNSNVVQEPKDQLLKNLKLNNKLAQGQKEKMRVKISKKVKESHSKKKSNSLESQVVPSINLSKNDEVEKLNCNLVGESSVKNELCKTKTNKKASIKSTNKEKSIKEAERTENEHLSEKISEVQMELDSFHSVEKSETCDNSTSSDNSVDAEMAQETILDISVDISNSSESGKEKHNIIRDMGGITEKAADLTVNNSNETDVQTDFKNSGEFDEKMKNNYLAFCKMKEVLEAIGISIEEVFENTEMINSLDSVPPNGAIKINKCKSDSKILFVCMNQKRK
ncbi:hypothetical protein AVEN_259895-1 [Araneus ventricosus]|uniref:Uncharacterized protein n=1 Tax=Araneus ventricosus TaxID=182803 RepID=A0A4Y2JBM0_ARAVE|nr:hypothetical protein AVEN_259895-1 [Araneus ventricosus]